MTGGKVQTTALNGSTEEAQFEVPAALCPCRAPRRLPKLTHAYRKRPPWIETPGRGTPRPAPERRQQFPPCAAL